MKFCFNWPSGLEKKSFEMVDRQTDGQHRTDDGACLYYKLTNEPKDSDDLKILTNVVPSGL